MNRLLSQSVNFQTLAPYVRYIQEISDDDDYRVPPRVIYDHEIIYVLKGQCEYTIEGQPYLLQAGDIHLMLPHVRHSCRVPAQQVFHYFAVHFDPIYMGEELDFSADDVYLQHDYQRLDRIPDREDLSERPKTEWGEVSFPYVMSARNPKAYAALFRRMLKTFADKRYGYQLALRSCLLEVLSLMVSDLAMEKEEERAAPIRSEIAQVINEMELHYSKPLHLEGLAELVFLAPNYLRNLFKQETGRTPVEYLTHIRLGKAKEMLLTEPYTIGEIAEKIGYPDIHHFSKLFKKFEGLSPKHYRETLQRYSPNSK
ncbi:AraC family transcriptional regulator [Cohnella abietis]|uniref:AraC family transcriptional regulator n=1 Tax=Cohnella abietis TaxID=2507935 RepID=A0A3T1D1K0_9BACL|nr:AraC family transcriptional regulator [Cohnella abietis]BBI31987.1 AraC family transcriptional regulator [Cohnella abietis]